MPPSTRLTRQQDLLVILFFFSVLFLHYFLQFYNVATYSKEYQLGKYLYFIQSKQKGGSIFSWTFPLSNSLLSTQQVTPLSSYSTMSIEAHEFSHLDCLLLRKGEACHVIAPRGSPLFQSISEPLAAAPPAFVWPRWHDPVTGFRNKCLWESRGLKLWISLWVFFFLV